MARLEPKLLVILFVVGCVSGNTQRLILNSILKEYDINDWPDAEFDQPTEVRIQLFINSFGSLNAANMDYSVDIFLRQQWVDTRLQNTRRDKSITIRDPEMQNRIWKPDTYFHNVKNAAVHTVTMPNIQFRINSTGHVLYSMRVTSIHSCNMDFEDYPFDEQQCGIHISSYANTNEIVKYRWVKDNPIDLPEGLEIAQFDLMNYSLSDSADMSFSTGNFSGLKVNFDLRRQNGYHILQTYIPTVLIVSMSWVSFWLDPNAVPGRVSLGVTTLLTLTTLASGIRQQLPPVSYIKAIDVWVGICMFMVFGALLEFTLVNWLANKKIVRRNSKSYDLASLSVKEDGKDKAERKTYISRARFFDRVSRVVFPGFFLIFNCIYWPYYMTLY